MLRAPEGRAVMRIAGVLATLATSSTLVGSDWPDGPNKDFFQKLQRPEGKWVRIPPEKIVPDHAPDGQAYLFVFRIAGRNGLRFDEIVCFVRPKGGL